MVKLKCWTAALDPYLCGCIAIAVLVTEPIEASAQQPPAAANAWRTGANGFYYFNIDIFPDTIRPQCFSQLGDQRSLATLNKLFAATDVAPYLRLLEDPSLRHCGLAEVLLGPMALPADLSSGGDPHIVTLQIGDDIASAAKQGILAGATLKIRFSDPAMLDATEVKLNGQVLVPVSKEPGQNLLNFSPKPNGYRMGLNEVSIRATKTLKSHAEPFQVRTVEVDVQYVN